MNKKYPSNPFHKIDRGFPVTVLYHTAVFIVMVLLFAFVVVQNMGRQVSWIVWVGLAAGILAPVISLYRHQQTASRLARSDIELQFHLLVVLV